MGSDKLTKKLGQFIALGAIASASLAYATEPAKVEAAKPASVAAAPAKPAKKVKKAKTSKSVKPAAAKTPASTPAK